MKLQNLSLLISLAFLSGIDANAAVPSIEERALALNKRIKARDEKTDQLRFKLLYADQLENVGKDFSSQVSLIAFENISSDFFGLPIKKLKNNKNGYLTEVEAFNTYRDINYNSPIESISPITTNLSLIKFGEKFSVVEYMNSKNFDSGYVVKDSKGNIYEVPEEKFGRYFVNTSIVKDLPSQLSRYNKEIETQANEFKGMFCISLHGPSTEKLDYDQGGEFLKNSEDFDHKIIEWKKFTEASFKTAIDKLTKNNKITQDPYIYSTRQNIPYKNICYGLYFKDAQSYLNSLYFFPRLLNGRWR